MIRSTHTLTMIVAILVGSALAAQQAPVFRSSAEYVIVDAVATDKSGATVKGLTRDDFQIVERGQQQAIVEFRHVTVPRVTRQRAMETSTSIGGDVVSNVPPGDLGRAFVVVIDDLHTLEYDIASVKSIVTKFLSAVSPADEVAVVFVGRSDLSVNFTSDPSRQLEAVENVREAFGFGVDVLGRTSNSDTTGNLLATGRALAFTVTNAARSLAASAYDRRAIVLVSAGSPVEQRPGRSDAVGQILYTEMTKAFEVARESNTPIYSIDPRGLVQPGDAVRGGIGQVRVPTRKIVERIEVQRDNMTTPALNTGGVAFINQSNLGAAVEAIVDDNSDYYILGYRPTPSADSDSFQPIKVSVRRPGVRVRARAGYFPRARSTGEVTDVETVESALGAGIDVKGLGLRVHAAPISPIDGRVRTLMTIRVAYPPESEIGFVEPDVLTVLAVALDPEGTVVASSGRQFPLDPTKRADDSDSIEIADFIDLPLDNTTLRIGVTSRRLRKTGTVQIPMELNREKSAKLEISSVVVGQSVSANSMMLGEDRARSLLPFRPTTLRTFAPGDVLRLFAQLEWTSDADLASVTVGLRGMPESVAQSVQAHSAPSSPKGVRTASVDLSYALGNATGSVVLEVTARLPNGQITRKEVVVEVK